MLKIGLAGCGRMGAGMLRALCRAGFDAHGFDVRPATDFPGLPVTNDVDHFAADLHTLISVVRDIEQTEDVLFAAQALATRAPLQRVILCSTLSPNYLRALPDRLPGHITLIDAPMSGAQVAADEARLSFMLGGTPQALDAAQPLFDAMGAHFHRMGAFCAGMQAKVLNNLLAASHTAMTRLVLDWGDATGLDPAKLLALIATSSGQNWFASGFDDIEFARDGYDADNTIGIVVKDIDSALDAAPPGARTALPDAVKDAIARLTPRTETDPKGLDL